MGNILIPYTFEVRSDETELHGNGMEPCRLMYGMQKSNIERRFACKIST